MNASAIVAVLIVLLVMSFTTFRDLAASGTLKGVVAPSITSE